MYRNAPKETVTPPPRSQRKLITFPSSLSPAKERERERDSFLSLCDSFVDFERDSLALFAGARESRRAREQSRVEGTLGRFIRVKMAFKFGKVLLKGPLSRAREIFNTKEKAPQVLWLRKSRRSVESPGSFVKNSELGFEKIIETKGL